MRRIGGRKQIKEKEDFIGNANGFRRLGMEGRNFNMLGFIKMVEFLIVKK